MYIDLLSEAKQIKEELINIRRNIHMKPELGFEEHNTGKLVKRVLSNLGIETKGIAGTGIVGLLKGKYSGKTVALRADMDALPLTDNKKVEYASQIKGKMHACGHDVHVAGLLGAAMLLCKFKENIAGQVKFLFQPAEETTGGALPMIREGAMENPKVDAVFGLHCNPSLEVGKIGVTYGKAYAASDMFDIEIKGASCHGASPHQGIDAIAVGAQIINGIQTIISRNVDPLDSAVITIGQFIGGKQRNVVAESAILSGIIRTLDPSTREKVKSNFINMVTRIAEGMGAEIKVNITPSYPSLITDETMTDIAVKVVGNIIGKENIAILKKPTMSVEDFAYFLQKAPGTFLQLGVRNEQKGITYPLHSTLFDVDENALPVASAVLAGIALEFLKRKSL